MRAACRTNAVIFEIAFSFIGFKRRGLNEYVEKVHEAVVLLLQGKTAGPEVSGSCLLLFMVLN